jgi:hypothetical protein
MNWIMDSIETAPKEIRQNIFIDTLFLHKFQHLWRSSQNKCIY